MIKQLVVLLVVVSVVLCQDNLQQQQQQPKQEADATIEAAKKLMDKFNAIVEKAKSDQEGHKHLGLFNKIKRHPGFEEAINIIVSNPINNMYQAKCVANQLDLVMPVKVNMTFGQILLQISEFVQHFPEGPL